MCLYSILVVPCVYAVYIVYVWVCMHVCAYDECVYVLCAMCVFVESLLSRQCALSAEDTDV